MDEKTKTRRFLSRVIRDYYSSVDLTLPYRFTKREFAFVYMGGKGMHRPVAFSKKNEFKSFMREKTPLHSYYSTAYYTNPQAPMADKEWIGADLVFDLDADHLPGGDDLTYPEQLKEVKKKTRLLLDDYLKEDFGFQEDDLSLYFSGHRGYHIHVRRNDVLQLSSHARREIVDYITGRGLDMDIIFPTETFKISEFMDKKKTEKSPMLPPEDEGGWRRKTREMTIQLVKRWKEMSREEVIREMEQKHGVGEKTARGLYECLFEREGWKDVVDKGILDVFPAQRTVSVSTFLDIIKGVILEENIMEVRSGVVGSTDEPVTGDTKRLIRLPSSLHGGSFMKVTPIDIGDFENFHPFERAIPEVLGESSYRIRFSDMPSIEEVKIKDRSFGLEKEMEVPEYAVPLLTSKFKATLI